LFQTFLFKHAEQILRGDPGGPPKVQKLEKYLTKKDQYEYQNVCMSTMLGFEKRFRICSKSTLGCHVTVRFLGIRWSHFHIIFLKYYFKIYIYV